jgi:hypothetical protein
MSALLVTAQRTGGSTAVAPDPSLILQEEKPFVAPCGTKPKLETNCAGKSAADKKDCIDCVNTIFKKKCVEPNEAEKGSEKEFCKSVTDCFESIVFQC